ncbi:MAG: FtsX-like permease family protein [Lachnospiraceae bacterium]|nr:FtsX-like permease family protein [Lachnospiraceae bacterium]
MKSNSKITVREILSSKARFFSILVIILLGVAFYTGIKSSGPDMNLAVNELFEEYNLMDGKIVSNFGIDEDDIALLEKDERITDVFATHSFDVNLLHTSNVVKFMEYNPDARINHFIVVEGRLPKNPGEIALDEEAFRLNKDLAVGQEYIVETEDEGGGYLNQNVFTIVGIVRSPMYLEKGARGTTSVGKGSVDYFAVVNKEDISMDVYTEVYVRFANVEGMNGYSEEYSDLMEENKAHLEELFTKRQEERAKEAPIFSSLAYYVSERTDNTGYGAYKDSIQSLDNIASVLPVFFFLLAAMICLTTMTRMVEENRMEIGTLKALGYHDFEIAKKYVIYAALASITGCILGILIGSTILPMIISNAHESLYSIPPVVISYYPAYIIQSLAISILCTVGASLFVIWMELKSKPANLMRAKAPKIGKRILLERITPLWKRFNFNYKVTFRNLFRYKQRMFMTVFGISGCMAILVTGFGLKDSNEGVTQKQFEKLWTYEAMVIRNGNATEEQKADYQNVLADIEGYEDGLSLHQEALTISKEGMNSQNTMLCVPEDPSYINDYILLNDRVSGEVYELPDDGVIVTEKLAKLLGSSAGDTIAIKDETNQVYEVKIAHVAENYIKHYLYMSPAYYEQIFGKPAVYNTELLNLTSTADENAVSEALLGCEDVLNITFTSKMRQTSEDSSANMNLVMIVIIVAAGSLAFVVLYNLNNINVSERIHELSTIKVLGFYDQEVTMYIVRENVMLTLFGIIGGSILGKMLHAFILYTAETDNAMMDPHVTPLSFLLAAGMTVFFSVVVMISMHIKLRNVNMIDALKSNE